MIIALEIARVAAFQPPRSPNLAFGPCPIVIGRQFGLWKSLDAIRYVQTGEGTVPTFSGAGQKEVREKVKLQHWFGQLRPGNWNGWLEAAYKQRRYLERLLTVQEHLAECLDIAPAGSVRIISICAGDGRDVIDVLRLHHRRIDAAAWLVELNRQSIDAGVCRATSAGLENTVRFLNQDATIYQTYKDIVPADIVLVCGVWGHVPTDERRRLVQTLAALCRRGAMVIWTRRVGPHWTRFEEIDSLFADSAWQKVRISFTTGEKWAVVTNRYCGPPTEFPAGGRFFHFRRRAGK
jgi:hypothetical protein